MTLDQFLADRQIKEADFAAKIGATQPTVNRLRKGQVPGKELMAAIFAATDGSVTANDFFDTIPTQPPAERPTPSPVQDEARAAAA